MGYSAQGHNESDTTEGLSHMQSTSCEMPGWMNYKLEPRLLGEISITSDLQMIPLYLSWQKGKRKSLLLRVKEESEKPA